MKYTIGLLSAAALLCGCQRNEGFDAPADGGIAFRVSNPTAKSKGVPAEAVEQILYLEVSAYVHSDPWSPSVSAQTLMQGVRLEQSADGGWSYAPVRSWPAEGSVSFFAVWPAPSADNGMQLERTLLSYRAPEAAQQQPDIVVAAVVDRTRAADAETGVRFDLSHSLTCVGVKASGNGQRIVRAEVSGVSGSGSLELGTAPLTWSVDASDVLRTFSFMTHGEILDPTPGSVLSDDGFLMMVPQTLPTGAKLTIEVDDGDQLLEQTFDLSGQTWTAGEVVEYTLAVSSSGAVLLNPGHATLPWTSGSSTLLSVVCPVEKPDQAWGLSLEPQSVDWLVLCDNPHGGVNDDPTQTDPLSYTGQGDKTLYVYATKANDTSADRACRVVLQGTSQSVEVVQLATATVYEPPVHVGWAGSYVYWVPDAALPEGGYLTFADAGDTSKELYQGVYFMWGSLVPLSPMGGGWSGQTLFVPNPDPATNGGWDPATNSSYTAIPRMGWSNEANPNSIGSAVALAPNPTQSYVYQNHNPRYNVGDVCKYITDRGWAPGAQQGRRWRMPTLKEFTGVISSFEVFGQLQPLSSTDRNGQAIYPMGLVLRGAGDEPRFPASGYRDNYGTLGYFPQYRPGELLTLWSGSSDTRNGSTVSGALDFYLGRTSPTTAQGFDRAQAVSVRCVEEPY